MQDSYKNNCRKPFQLLKGEGVCMIRRTQKLSKSCKRLKNTAKYDYSALRNRAKKENMAYITPARDKSSSKFMNSQSTRHIYNPLFVQNQNSYSQVST